MRGWLDLTRMNWRYVHYLSERREADNQHHPKHPDEVADAITAKEDAYGELRHEYVLSERAESVLMYSFMTKVIEQTGLGPNSVL
jgi:hypothetical protein